MIVYQQVWGLESRAFPETCSSVDTTGTYTAFTKCNYDSILRKFSAINTSQKGGSSVRLI